MGIRFKTSKGDAWPGEHEINVRYAAALTMVDYPTYARTEQLIDRAVTRDDRGRCSDGQDLVLEQHFLAADPHRSVARGGLC